MAESRINFEIEQNPEDPEWFGVWELDSEDPDNDEIVQLCFGKEAAEKWVKDHTPVTEEYLKSRGIIG